MPQLNSRQRKYLKARAHALKPVIQIGKAGANEHSLQSIDLALAAHELIKVRFIAFKEEKEPQVQVIVEKTQAGFVSLIGHVLMLYREHAEAEKRRYKLPE